jgi:hypothetical protein
MWEKHVRRENRCCNPVLCLDHAVHVKFESAVQHLAAARPISASLIGQVRETIS